MRASLLIQSFDSDERIQAMKERVDDLHQKLKYRDNDVRILVRKNLALKYVSTLILYSCFFSRSKLMLASIKRNTV